MVCLRILADGFYYAESETGFLIVVELWLNWLCLCMET